MSNIVYKIDNALRKELFSPVEIIYDYERDCDKKQEEQREDKDIAHLGDDEVPFLGKAEAESVTGFFKHLLKAVAEIGVFRPGDVSGQVRAHDIKFKVQSYSIEVQVLPDQ